jgi:uncharacterized protein YcbK (DUF882 family)
MRARSNVPGFSARQIGVGLRTTGAATAAGFVAILAFSFAVPGPRSAQAVGETRTLTLHHIHTGEDITITFKKNGQYDDDALKKLDHFVRDWRKDEGVQMDPKLYDMMWEVVQEVGYKGAVHIVCGYRSPATNAMLRSRSSGVARTSMHMAGKAMDFSMPGADVAAVRAAALRVQGGGVGYYPSSGLAFVHMDVGNVRHWPRMTREQLAKVFPDGRTLHVPSDGQPMPGYALALADAERGVTNGPKPRSLFASLFGGAPDQEEIADRTSLSQRPASPPRRVAALAPAAAPTEELKPVPLPQRRPVFEVASHDSRPVTLPPRNVNVAALTPNQIIGLRGYWQGPQDTAPAVTASVGGTNDRVPPEIALAYASRGEPQPAIAPAMITRQDSALIAQKPAEPASTARIAANSERLDNPWLRGVVLAPRLENAMTITTFGAPDFGNLKPFMQKPASSVMMTFSADPHLGMNTDQFSGSAVVFQATVTFGMRTAALQQ